MRHFVLAALLAGGLTMPLRALAAEALVLGEPVRVTLSGTPNTQLEVQLPARTRRVWIKFESNAGSFEASGTDGGTRDTTDYWVFAADTDYDIRPECAKAFGGDVSSSGCSIYLSSPTGSTVVALLATSATD